MSFHICFRENTFSRVTTEISTKMLELNVYQINVAELIGDISANVLLIYEMLTVSEDHFLPKTISHITN